MGEVRGAARRGPTSLSNASWRLGLTWIWAAGGVTGYRGRPVFTTIMKLFTYYCAQPIIQCDVLDLATWGSQVPPQTGPGDTIRSSPTEEGTIKRFTCAVGLKYKVIILIDNCSLSLPADTPPRPRLIGWTTSIQPTNWQEVATDCGQIK
jgi:hypothetical protein